MKARIIELVSVDSTNNYAMAQIGKGAVAEGTAYLAREQTAGRGQRGKSWTAAPGQSILLSLILKPVAVKPDQQFFLSAAVALGAHDFFTHYAGGNITIKWSNDIYWNDRKAGGILIENVIRGQLWNYAVVGIGFNINQAAFPDHLPNPVSLRQITGLSWEVRELAADLCRFIGLRYTQLQEKRFGEILEAYRQRLFRFGMPARYQSKGRSFEGIIKDVLPDGRLVLNTGQTEQLYTFGEITFVPDRREDQE